MSAALSLHADDVSWMVARFQVREQSRDYVFAAYAIFPPPPNVPRARARMLITDYSSILYTPRRLVSSNDEIGLKQDEWGNNFLTFPLPDGGNNAFMMMCGVAQKAGREENVLLMRGLVLAYIGDDIIATFFRKEEIYFLLSFSANF